MVRLCLQEFKPITVADEHYLWTLGRLDVQCDKKNLCQRGEKRGKRGLSNFLEPVGPAFGFNPFAGSNFLSVPRNTGGKKKGYKVQTGLCAECESEHFMLWLLGSDEGKKPSI